MKAEAKAMTAQERLIYWIVERENIRSKKEGKEPKPWTTDSILQKYRFCNVRRMDDKVSKWLQTKWYTPHFNHPNMLIACVLARHFNLPRTLDVITDVVFSGLAYEQQKPKIANAIEALKDSGYQVFNSAYVIVASKRYKNKVDQVLEETVQQIADDPPSLDISSIRRCVNRLMTYKNFGGFMAGQVIADYRWAVAGTWEDRNDWAIMGPGSKRGMNRLLGNSPEKPLDQMEFNAHLVVLMGQLKKALPGSITMRLEAIDYQNCLCEWDKYERTRLGEGKPKQRYPGI